MKSQHNNNNPSSSFSSFSSSKQPLMILKLLLIVTLGLFQTCDSSTFSSSTSITASQRKHAVFHQIPSFQTTHRYKPNHHDNGSKALILDSLLSVKRGGYVDVDVDSDEYDSSSDDDEEVLKETESEDESEEEDEEEESEEEEYDYEEEESEEEEYDYEEEESEEEEELEQNVSKSYDEPLTLSPMTDMGVTLGVMVLCNKLDLTNTKIIKIARFAFIAYIVLAQIFLIYVRYKAHLINDRTPITINNPLSSLVKNQLSSASSGGGDMVKNMANSFLSSQSTFMEYDLSQAKSMNNGLLFPMVMLWFLHFKLGQVQPLFFQTASGVKDFIMSPLFQIYFLGRNLERPFKNKKMEEMQKSQEEEISGTDSEKDEDVDTEVDASNDIQEDDSDIDSSSDVSDEDYDEDESESEYDSETDEE